MANFFIVYAFIVAAIVFEKLVVNRSFGRAVLFVAVAIIAATIVGLRPLDAGYDTAVYVSYFNLIGHENLLSINEVYAYNFQYDYLYKLWNFFLAKLGFDESSYLYITACVSILLFLVSLEKLFRRDSLLIFLLFYSTPAFVSLFGNAIRQGLSIPFFLFTLYHLLTGKRILMFVFFAITILLHNFTGIILLVLVGIRVLLLPLMRNRKALLLVLLLLIQPAAYYLSSVLYTILPTEYLTFVGGEYFFHYSFVLFLAIYAISFLTNLTLTSRDGQLLEIYISISFVTSLVWYHPDTFGRVVYLGFPFLCFFVSRYTRLYNIGWMKPAMILGMLFVGMYFFGQSSTSTTLSSVR